MALTLLHSWGVQNRLLTNPTGFPTRKKTPIVAPKWAEVDLLAYLDSLYFS